MLKLSGQTAFSAARHTGTILKFRKGEVIYAQEEPANVWFRVIAGTVRTCLLYPDGHRQLTGFFYNGDAFGLDADFYRASAEAVTAVTLHRFSKSPAQAAVPDDVAPTSSLLQSALNHAQLCISLLGRRTANERVAAFILATGRRIGGSGSINLPMTRADIADHLGLTIHTVSRTLSELARRGIIALDGPQSIAIRNPHVLRQLADGEEKDVPQRQGEQFDASASQSLSLTPAEAFGR